MAAERMDTPTTSPAQWLHERVPAIAGRDAPQFELDCLSVISAPIASCGMIVIR